MNHQKHIVLLLLFMSVLIGGCGKNPVKENQGAVKDPTKNDQSIGDPSTKKNKDRNKPPIKVVKNIDTAHVFIDTLLSVSECSIAVTHDRLDANKKEISNDDRFYNPITIYILKNDSVVHHQKFEENMFDRIITYHSSDPTFSYMALMTFGGGSGYLIDWYKFSLNTKPYFLKICTYNELASYVFSTDGKELLVLQGIWDFDEDETHFEEHRYQILKYNLSKPGSEPVIEETTIGKYPSLFEGGGAPASTLIELIKEKEPDVLKQIDLSKYSFK